MYIHCPISKSKFERPFKIRYHNLTNVSRKDYCNIDGPTEDARICSKRAATRDHHHQVPMQSWVYTIYVIFKKSNTESKNVNTLFLKLRH